MSTTSASISSSLIAVSGLVKFSTADYPGQLAAVIFCQGCPWRCGYCHNPHLQRFGAGEIGWDKVWQFLQERQGLLDAVVFSGGEPTLQPDLSEAMRMCRALGYRIGLHTGGCSPDLLRAPLALADWVGFDFKALPADYASVTGSIASGGAALACLDMLIAAGVDFEVRTTYHSHLFGEEQLLELARLLVEKNVQKFRVQEFRPTGCSNDELKSIKAQALSAQTREVLQSMFDDFCLRQAG